MDINLVRTFLAIAEVGNFVRAAEQLNVTVCGYVRPDSLNVYAGDAVTLADEWLVTGSDIPTIAS